LATDANDDFYVFEEMGGRIIMYHLYASGAKFSEFRKGFYRGADPKCTDALSILLEGPVHLGFAPL